MDGTKAAAPEGRPPLPVVLGGCSGRETVSEPVCVEISNSDDQPHRVMISVVRDNDVVFEGEFSLEPGERVRTECFRVVGEYFVSAETESGRTAFGPMEVGFDKDSGVVFIGDDGEIEFSQTIIN